MAKFNEVYGGLNLTRNELAEHITSKAVQVCFCNDNKTYDCTINIIDVSVKRGGQIKLMITAVDQVQNQVAATMIATFSNHTNSGNSKEEQTKRRIDSVCTELEYNVYSDKPQVLINLYADGPCEDWGLSKRTLNVTFLPCTCSIGL